MKNEVLIKLRGGKPRAEVAAALGITTQGLGLIERGERMPRKNLMIKFSLYYKKTIDELFFSSISSECIKM